MTEWIPVVEKLPEDGQQVLVLHYSNMIQSASYSALLGTFYATPQGNTLANITDWQPRPLQPKKKRWMPKVGEKFYLIGSSSIGIFIYEDYWKNDEFQSAMRMHVGVYRTHEEAAEMLDKIKAFVTEQIGEP